MTGKFKLSNQVVAEFNQHIKNHLRHDDFKSLFLNFFADDYSQQFFTKQDRTAIHNSFEKFLFTIFENYSLESFSWKQYCLSMKYIRDQNWNDLSRTQRIARKLLSDLYYYTAQNIHLNLEGLTEINEYKEFLVWNERPIQHNHHWGEYLTDRIGTNFPIESSLDKLYYIPGSNESEPYILNLNISEGDIKNLLLGFYWSERHPPLNSLKHFLYLFRYSLAALDQEPRSISDFTFEVFKKQFRFYKKMNNVNIARTYSRSDSYKFPLYLVRFYLYLCKIIKEQNLHHNIFAGTLYNEHILGERFFTYHYESGYKLLPYNPFEEVPSENRWRLIPSDGFASIKKNKPFGINFLEVKDKSLREDLKHYVWKQSNMSVATLGISIYMLIDFLNFISDYKLHNELNGDTYVDMDVLEQWNFYISYKKTSTRNNYIKLCKSYLRFFKDKYQIPTLLINTLKKKPEDYDGGNPITKHDINLFNEKFQEQRSRGNTEELYYIIFNIAVTTKLRLGEILALERDCIEEKFEQTGVIQYYSKVTGNQKVKLTLGNEKINLIEKAIRFTEDAHSKASGDIAKYIFVKEDSRRKNRIIDFVYQFWKVFSNIQKDLEGRLEGKYRPYDLRSTFIDNIYTEGIIDGLPTSVIAEMAGNGVQTARKYYRKATEAQEYAEMFAGVTVSGVDVYGNILQEKEVENLNPVKQGLGGCKQKGCVIDDEQYECVICPHFATTINRIPLFKKHITKLKTLKENTLNSQERSLLDAQLKLYTAYYIKLLEKNGGE